MKSWSIAAAGAAAVLALGAASTASAAGNRTALPGSVPGWAKASKATANASGSSPVGFRVYLNLRNQAQAEAQARAVSDPSSPSFGQYLTPNQFLSKYAPAPADVNAVKSWLRDAGFSVTYTPSNNHYVAAEGTVDQVQSAFGAQLKMYSVNGQTLRAPAADLTVPASLAPTVAGVIGVDQSAALVQTFAQPDKAAPPSAGFRNAQPCSSYWGEKTTANTPVADPALGIGSTTLPDYSGAPRPFAPCGYAGAQLQQPYGVASAIASGNDGSGQTVAIIDAYASPTIASDANTYSGRHGLPAFRPGQFSQVVAPGTYKRSEGPRQDPQGWWGEETLDVEAVHTMAPGANIVYVGAPNNYQDLDAALNHVVSKRLADIVSNSYGWNTEALAPGFIKPYNDTMMQAVLEGIGLYFSSGDDGDETFGDPAATPTPDWPASSPWVTAVGGTSLGVAKDNSYQFETGWGTKRNRLNCDGLLRTAGNAWCGDETYLYGSGGGTSRLFAEPDYQQGVVPAALANRWKSQTGRSGRVLPDIAAVGDPTTGMLVGQTQSFSDGAYYDEYRIGGTSLSSPLMAGVMAVAQQKAGRTIGFANPILYRLPSGAFHDVVAPASPMAAIRTDYANSENGNDGLLFTVRTMDATNTLHTVPGYDDVTGRGTPDDAFVGAVAAATP
jgi:subtilase family serine protease